MPKRRKISGEDRYRLWWEKSFNEREDLLRERFGETDPPGYVSSFTWADPRLIIPGACALCFPPQREDRQHWLYLSHGLTQPWDPQAPIPGRWSGYGCEFGIVTRDKGPWAVDILYLLMTYWKSDGATIGVGHRVPLAFFDRSAGGQAQPELGMIQDSDPVPPVGEMRALVFWKYSLQPKPLWTNTGYFDILIGTTITRAEWQMIKETSPAHVLLLLSRAGIGQESEMGRVTVTADPRWAVEWNEIRSLPDDEVNRLLEADR
jgi:hypothetical protein